jgi:hypothetical protein
MNANYPQTKLHIRLKNFEVRHHFHISTDQSTLPKMKPSTPHLSHMQATSMYEIKTAGLKGLGVFAKELIPRGTRIFSEKPLLAIRQGENAGEIYSASRLLSSTDRRKFLGLSTHITKELTVLRWSQAAWYMIQHAISSMFGKLGGKGGFSMPSMKEHVTVLSIFRNNAFNLGSLKFQQAVFPRISRINHSCIPNAQGNFHEKLGRFNIHATRDIKPDEELTLNYLQEHGATRVSRKLQLLNGYGFTCECPACDLSSSRGRDGEKRRVKMHEELVKYIEGVASGAIQSLDAELKTVQRFIQLLEGEGIAGRELSTL